jgi:hypothetical protein
MSEGIVDAIWHTNAHILEPASIGIFERVIRQLATVFWSSFDKADACKAIELECVEKALYLFIQRLVGLYHIGPEHWNSIGFLMVYRQQNALP